MLFLVQALGVPFLLDVPCLLSSSHKRSTVRLFHPLHPATVSSMVSDRPAGALAALAVGTQPDGNSFPTLIPALCAHLKKKLGKRWAGACASIGGSLARLRLALGPGSEHYQCPPAPQSDARGTMRLRDGGSAPCFQGGAPI